MPGREAFRESSSSSAGNSPPRKAVVLQTHFIDRPVEKLFASIRRDLPPGYDTFILMHVAPGTPKPAALNSAIPHHFVTTTEIRNPAYFAKSAGGEEWRVWRGGHTDLIALHFFNAHPEYDRYWFIEYDVRFSGPWSELFTSFESDPADFISCNMRRATTDPDWMHWPSLRTPAGTGELSATDRLASFMPIFRVSRRALATVDRAYREGWSGHCEVTWATIMHRAGLRLRDFGGDGEFVALGNRNRFYTNTLHDKDLAPGSLVFRPARAMVGFRRNRLWHPVKPLRYKLREDARHIWVSLKPYLRWVPGVTPPIELPAQHQRSVTYWTKQATPGPSQRSS
ncbi:MAG: hypothetical protein JO227_13535 [Acetobacteraceae bacterium]|nr:hypothetical protein [Acetobacteraceae bacterium]